MLYNDESLHHKCFYEINCSFGCWVQGKRTGIIYNNEMDDFSKPTDDNLFELPPSPLNFIEPGKRPVSSMSPLFLTNLDGEITHAIGGAGGSMITTQVVDVCLVSSLCK